MELDRFSCYCVGAIGRYVHPFFEERMRQICFVNVHLQEKLVYGSQDYAL
jgi:hypothetical protein